MSFGFSVGDFVAVGELIARITSSLKDAGGAKSEYQELLRALETLEAALHRVDKLQPSGSTSTNLVSIKYTALSCRRPLEEFLARTRKYDKSLGLWAKESAIKSTVDKLRWTFRQRDGLSNLQTYLEIHVGTINILLAEYGLEKLDHISSHQLDIEERLEDTRAIVDGIKDNIEVQALAVQRNSSLLTKLYQVVYGELSVSWTSLVNMVAKVCVSTQQIYSVLLEIRSFLPLDTRWTFFQDPYAFEDALGYKYPIPSEFDFELFQAIIKFKFRESPGYRQVIMGNYEIFRTRDPQQTICASTRLSPGAAITMALLFNKPDVSTECCPMPQCRSIGTLLEQGGGKTCCECNVWFDISTKKRKSFSDVARLVGDSEYQWLADDVAKRSFSNLSSRTMERPSCHREDTRTYKNVKFSTGDTIRSEEETLEDSLEDGLGVFAPEYQIALTDNFRSYDRGKLSVDGLRASIRQLLEYEGLKIRVEVVKDTEPERSLDTIVISMSPLSINVPESRTNERCYD